MNGSLDAVPANYQPHTTIKTDPTRAAKAKILSTVPPFVLPTRKIVPVVAALAVHKNVIQVAASARLLRRCNALARINPDRVSNREPKMM
jgi:hypothetical protein